MHVLAQWEFQTTGGIVQADVRLDGDMALAVGLDLGGGMDPGGGILGPHGNGEENDAEHKREDTAHGITSQNCMILHYTTVSDQMQR